MSTASTLPPPLAPVVPAPFPRVMIAEEIVIPSEVVDLESFSRWLCSEQAPRRGHFSFLNGTIWVDLSMEELYTHNLVKGAFYRVLGNLVDQTAQGLILPDGMLLRNAAANLSTEPDGMFVSFQALQSGTVQRVPGATPGIYELEGSPEMVLEIVSATSVRKDTVELRELYHRAGIQEYWLVDVRDLAALQFDILRRSSRGYTTTRRQAEGWLKSVVLGQSFHLTHTTDPLGDPRFVLEVR